MISKLITKPKNDAVTLDAVKGHLRIDKDDILHDDRLVPYLNAAIDEAANKTGRALITQTWETIFQSWDEMGTTFLPYGQFQSVISLKYFDSDGDENIISSDDYDVAGIGTDEGRIIYDEAPALRRFDPVFVQFKCGYGDTADDIPGGLQAAIMLMVEDMETGADVGKAVNSLLRPSRLRQ